MPLQPGRRLVRPRYGSAFTGSGGIILLVGGHLGLALLEQGGHGPGHGLNAFRLLFRQVVLFADVLLEVEEFELLVRVPVDKLPVPLAHGRAGGIKGVVSVPFPPYVGRVEEQGAVGIHAGAFQQGNKTFAVHNLRRLNFFCSRYFQNGGEKVFNDDGSGADAFRLRDPGPVDDHRFPDAAFPVGGSL